MQLNAVNSWELWAGCLGGVGIVELAHGLAPSLQAAPSFEIWDERAHTPTCITSHSVWCNQHYQLARQRPWDNSWASLRQRIFILLHNYLGSFTAISSQTHYYHGRRTESHATTLLEELCQFIQTSVCEVLPLLLEGVHTWRSRTAEEGTTPQGNNGKPY